MACINHGTNDRYKTLLCKRKHWTSNASSMHRTKISTAETKKVPPAVIRVLHSDSSLISFRFFWDSKSEGCTVPRRIVMVLYILVYKAKEINSAEFSQGSFPCQVTLISPPQYKFSVLSAGQFFWFQLGEFGFKSNDILWLVVFFFLPITFPLAKVLILERQIPYWSSLVVQG